MKLDHDGRERRHIEVLQAFVLRARRVKAHSLCGDPDALVALQEPTWKGHIVKETGEATLTMVLPPEEVMESAAARIRPFIVKSERTHHAKVMNAILHFAHKDGAPKEALDYFRFVKMQWGETEPHRDAVNFYRVAVKDGDEDEVAINDHVLAYAWIYGDVIHADPERRERSRIFGVQARYEAAVPVVVRYMLLAVTTLNIIEKMRLHTVIPDLDAAFDEDVVAKHIVERTHGKLMMARVDLNKKPDLDEPLFGEVGEEWLSGDALYALLKRLADESDRKPE